MFSPDAPNTSFFFSIRARYRNLENEETVKELFGNGGYYDKSRVNLDLVNNIPADLNISFRNRRYQTGSIFFPLNSRWYKFFENGILKKITLADYLHRYICMCEHFFACLHLTSDTITIMSQLPTKSYRSNLLSSMPPFRKTDGIKSFRGPHCEILRADPVVTAKISVRLPKISYLFILTDFILIVLVLAQVWWKEDIFWDSIRVQSFGVCHVNFVDYFFVDSEIDMNLDFRMKR